MGEQLDIFAAAPIATEATRTTQPRKPTLDERWADFHAANPHVFNELLKLARARRDRGETRIGVKALWEELRSWLQVTGGDTYKLNNDYTSLYARALIDADTSLAPLIEIRSRKADK